MGSAINLDNSQREEVHEECTGSTRSFCGFGFGSRGLRRWQWEHQTPIESETVGNAFGEPDNFDSRSVNYVELVEFEGFVLHGVGRLVGHQGNFRFGIGNSDIRRREVIHLVLLRLERHGLGKRERKGEHSAGTHASLV